MAPAYSHSTLQEDQKHPAVAASDSAVERRHSRCSLDCSAQYPLEVVAELGFAEAPDSSTVAQQVVELASPMQWPVDLSVSTPTRKAMRFVITSRLISRIASSSSAKSDVAAQAFTNVDDSGGGIEFGSDSG
jgi:hypothetical protein